MCVGGFTRRSTMVCVKVMLLGINQIVMGSKQGVDGRGLGCG